MQSPRVRDENMLQIWIPVESLKSRIVQKLDLDGWQKVKGLERTASNQPITQRDQKRPSKLAEYVAIVHSFAEFRGEETVAKQGEEAHEEESKAVKECQFIELSWLGSRSQRWHSKVIVDDAAQDRSLADNPFGQRLRSFDR